MIDCKTVTHRAMKIAVLRFEKEVYGKEEHENDEYESLATGFLLGFGFTHDEIESNVVQDMCTGNFEAYR